MKADRGYVVGRYRQGSLAGLLAVPQYILMIAFIFWCSRLGSSDLIRNMLLDSIAKLAAALTYVLAITAIASELVDNFTFVHFWESVFKV